MTVRALFSMGINVLGGIYVHINISADVIYDVVTRSFPSPCPQDKEVKSQHSQTT